MHTSANSNLKYNRTDAEMVQSDYSADTHSYGQLGRDVSRPSSCVLRVEVRRGAAQEAGFQDVSTATVGEEAALV